MKDRVSSGPRPGAARGADPDCAAKPRISIALATWNGAKFLSSQLDSLSNQTLQPDELVVSDDCSSDGTLEIIADFAKRSSFPVRLLRNRHRLGYRRNFRKAAMHCAGPLIAFCDQDDVWHPGKVERMSASFEEPDVLLAYHNAFVTDAQGTRLRLMLDGKRERRLLQQDPPPPFLFAHGLLQVFRSELLRYEELWDLAVDHDDGRGLPAHDQWFFFLALTLGRVRFVDEPLVDYVQHGGNTFGVPARFGMFDRMRLRLLHFGEQDEAMARSALSRAKVVRALAQTHGDMADRLQRIAGCFEDHSQRLRRRHQIYTRRGSAGRGGALARSLLCGDYGSRPWKFEPLSVLRDAWSGVVRRRARDPLRRSAEKDS